MTYRLGGYGELHRTGRSGNARRAGLARPPEDLRSAEFVPLPVHVTRLIHERVPAGDLAETGLIGTAVRDRSRLLHLLAYGAVMDALRRLAFVPIAPLVIGQELLGRSPDSGSAEKVPAFAARPSVPLSIFCY